MMYRKRLKWCRILYGDDVKIRKIYVSKGRRYFYIYDNGLKRQICYSRFKMEVKLGRRLKSWEDVHHEDGNTLHDKYKNLEVMSRGKHISLEMTGNKNPMYGRNGNKNPMYGRSGSNSPNWNKHHTKETKRKMRETWAIKRFLRGLRRKLAS
jgi:hypothetical protein